MFKMRNILITMALILAVALVPMGYSLAAPGDVYPESIGAVRTITFYPATALTGSTTVYSTAPAAGDRISNYSLMDVFATVDVASSTITVTAQFSADGTNWASGNAWAIGSNTSGVTTVNTHLDRLVLSSDGTKVMTIPTAGEYLRFMIEHTGTATPTVQVTLKNYN